MSVSLRRLFSSFKSAGKGVVAVWRTEQNFRIQIFASLIALAAAFYFSLKVWELILIILLIISVLTMELLNTALEYFTDLLKPRLNHYVYGIKNVMAAAVLITSVGALVIGVIIFFPHFINFGK